MEALEERVEAMERVLGLDEYPDAKPSQFDVAAVKKDLVDKGFNRIFNINQDKLRKLHTLMQKPESRPFGEKLNAIQFCEELIVQRAEMLKNFEEMFKVVVESEPIAAVSQHEAGLEAVTKEVQEAMDVWRACSLELEEFRSELTALMTALRTNVADLERKVAAKEAKEKK